MEPDVSYRNSSSYSPAGSRNPCSVFSVASPTPTVGMSDASTSVMRSPGTLATSACAVIQPDEPPPTIRTDWTRSTASGGVLGALARTCAGKRAQNQAVGHLMASALGGLATPCSRLRG